jgi:hypothetical protein
VSKPFRVILNADPSEVEEYANTDKIRTAILGNRFTEDWLPIDETVAGVLTCSENGDYVASEHGLFGFSKVDVLVDGMGGAMIEVDDGAGGVTVEWRDVPAGGAGTTMVATDPVTNVMTYYEIDSEGVIQETVVPSYAMVTTTPKTEYESATDAVDYTGMEITLYYGDDTEAEDFGPTIAYGSATWNAHVVADAGTVGEILRNGLIIVYVRPWWFQNGDELGREYHLRAYYGAEVQGA